MRGGLGPSRSRNQGSRRPYLYTNPVRHVRLQPELTGLCNRTLRQHKKAPKTAQNAKQSSKSSPRGATRKKRDYRDYRDNRNFDRTLQRYRPDFATISTGLCNDIDRTLRHPEITNKSWIKSRKVAHTIAQQMSTITMTSWKALSSPHPFTSQEAIHLVVEHT